MNTVKILFFCFVLFVCFCSFLETMENSNDESYREHPTLLNIYGEPLQPCRSDGSSDTRGSWNSNGYCDETGGGVHQICVEVNKTPDFSYNTGQGRWSDGRRGKNHCMCLGAWALYKARQERGKIPETNDELQCESIMDDALDSGYVNKWNTWNGNELPDQIVQGVEALYDQCYEKANDTQKENLQTLYDELMNNI